jgi:hypothetical protein
MTKCILLLLFFLCSYESAISQSIIVENRMPQQVLGGVVGGALGGFAGGVASLLAVEAFATNDTGWEALGYVVGGVLVGFTVGNGIGVYDCGNTSTEKGSLGITLLGSAVGLVVGVGVGSNMGEALLPVVATSVTLGSMLGYNMTRRSTVAFLQPATRSNHDSTSIRTPLTVPEASVALIRIRL